MGHARCYMLPIQSSWSLTLGYWPLYAHGNRGLEKLSNLLRSLEVKGGKDKFGSQGWVMEKPHLKHRPPNTVSFVTGIQFARAVPISRGYIATKFERGKKKKLVRSVMSKRVGVWGESQWSPSREKLVSPSVRKAPFPDAIRPHSIHLLLHPHWPDGLHLL